MTTLALGGRRPSFCILTVTIALLAWLNYVAPLSGEETVKDKGRLIEPGVRVGPITARTREVDLVRLLGRGNMRRENLDVGEGEKRPGTVVFPGSNDGIWLFWREDAYEIPERVVITGKGQRWRTAEGIGLGVTLETLVRLNGRNFSLHGFAWDYSGTVASWEGGRLGQFSDKLIVRVGPTVDLNSLAPKDLDTVLGEQVISSGTPALKRLNVTVYELVVNFEAKPASRP